MTKEQISKKETIWVAQYEKGIRKYLISSNLMRTRYYLYESQDGIDYEKIENNTIPKFKKLGDK